MSNCQTKIRAWDKDDGVFQCRKKYGHAPADPNHVATGLYEYQVIEWMDGDRRQFTGDWVHCYHPGCVLPAEHKAGHAQ